MPSYVFECPDCTVRFERNLRVEARESYPCPECGKAAPQVVSNFGFAFAQSKGTQNSGVHDLDYPTADKVVGRDAAARWADIHAREAVKKKAREQGQTHALIRHQGKDYIDYEPMSDYGFAARKALARETFSKMRKPKG